MTTLIISDYLENKILEYVLRNGTFATPGTAVWIALYTADPSDAGGGTEVTGGSYARKQVGGTTYWDAPASGHTQNNGAITWTTASADWGLICAIAIWDNSSGGNMLYWGELSVDKQVDNGDTFSIASGDLDITYNGDFGHYLGNAMLNHTLRNTSMTQPTTATAKLYTTLLGADGTGGTEVSGGSYAAQTIWGASDWDAASGGATQNTNVETYPTATANWGTVVGTALFDQTGLLFFKTLTSSKTVNNGDTFRFSAGAFDVAVQ